MTLLIGTVELVLDHKLHQSKSIHAQTSAKLDWLHKMLLHINVASPKEPIRPREDSK